jgi:hypothetical protein
VKVWNEEQGRKNTVRQIKSKIDFYQCTQCTYLFLRFPNVFTNEDKLLTVKIHTDRYHHWKWNTHFIFYQYWFNFKRVITEKYRQLISFTTQWIIVHKYLSQLPLTLLFFQLFSKHPSKLSEIISHKRTLLDCYINKHKFPPR